MNIREGKEPPKKKSIAFKATPSTTEEDESMNEGKEEEFFTLVRKVGKLFYKKERMSNF